MKRQKRRSESTDFFETPALPPTMYRASEVTRVVGIEKWRLEKFITGKQYRLSPSRHIGTGKGSWRLFTQEDLYRLACAKQMVEDGFTPTFVSTVLETIEDRDFYVLTEDGAIPTRDVPVYRSDKGPQLRKRSANQEPYYVLPLRHVVESVNKQISRKAKGDSE